MSTQPSAPAPTPTPTPREKLRAILCEVNSRYESVDAATDRILALLPQTVLPAPAPATSEDWRPMSHFDPNEMQFVLLHEDGAIRLRLWNPSSRRWELDDGREVLNATHYTELPALPPLRAAMAHAGAQKT